MSAQLPDFHEQSPAVRDRFQRIYQREIALQIEQLGKIFHGKAGEVEALRGIDFNVHRREFISIVGPSGCGKSTLIRIIAGLETATTGHVKVAGETVTRPGRDRGMVFQSYTLFPWLTVKRNVMFGLKNAGKENLVAEQDALQWIEIVGLKGFEDHYPHQLSGGMKQRVAIARALANQPKVLLMDEPFGALDSQTRAQMQSYLLQLWQNIDVTILFITHDLDEAVYLSDRILVLSAHPGEIKEMVENPVPRPRSPEQFIDPVFLATKQHIEHLIHPPGSTDDARELPITRLTAVDDDVF